MNIEYADNLDKVSSRYILGDVKIGEGTWIGVFTLLDGLYAPLRIGDNCNISSGVQILTHSTVNRCLGYTDKIDCAPVVIGEHVFIGTNAVIMKGCMIGHHSVIGAGTVLREGTVVPSHSTVVGVPGRIIPKDSEPPRMESFSAND